MSEHKVTKRESARERNRCRTSMRAQSSHGTYRTVKAMHWLWLSGKSPQNLLHVPFLLVNVLPGQAWGGGEGVTAIEEIGGVGFTGANTAHIRQPRPYKVKQLSDRGLGGSIVC